MASEKATAGAGALVSASGVVSERLPDSRTVMMAVRYSLNDKVPGDRPIILDYWYDGLKNAAWIGKREYKEMVVQENGSAVERAVVERILLKNAQEYTSPIEKLCRSDLDGGAYEIIAITQNSIYILPSNIQMRNIRNDAR